MKDLLTVDQTAAILDVDRRTIYYWLKKNIAPKGTHLHGKQFFYPKSVERYAKKRQKK